MTPRLSKIHLVGVICGLAVSVKKDHYTGLWGIYYDHGGRWAGPYKTCREAAERLAEERASEAERRQ